MVKKNYDFCFSHLFRSFSDVYTLRSVRRKSFQVCTLMLPLFFCNLKDLCSRLGKSLGKVLSPKSGPKVPKRMQLGSYRMSTNLYSANMNNFTSRPILKCQTRFALIGAHQ